MPAIRRSKANASGMTAGLKIGIGIGVAALIGITIASTLMTDNDPLNDDRIEGARDVRAPIKVDSERDWNRPSSSSNSSQETFGYAPPYYGQQMNPPCPDTTIRFSVVGFYGINRDFRKMNTLKRGEEGYIEYSWKGGGKVLVEPAGTGEKLWSDGQAWTYVSPKQTTTYTLTLSADKRCSTKFTVHVVD